MNARTRTNKQTSYKTGVWVFWGGETTRPANPEAPGLIWRVMVLVEDQPLYARWLSSAFELAQQAELAYKNSQWTRAARLIWKAIALTNEVQLSFLQYLALDLFEKCRVQQVDFSALQGLLAISQQPRLHIKHRINHARQAQQGALILFLQQAQPSMASD